MVHINSSSFDVFNYLQSDILTSAPILQGRAHVCKVRAAEAQIGQSRPRHGEPYNAIGGQLCATDPFAWN